MTDVRFLNNLTAEVPNTKINNRFIRVNGKVVQKPSFLQTETMTEKDKMIAMLNIKPSYKPEFDSRLKQSRDISDFINRKGKFAEGFVSQIKDATNENKTIARFILKLNPNLTDPEINDEIRQIGLSASEFQGEEKQNILESYRILQAFNKSGVLRKLLNAKKEKLANKIPEVLNKQDIDKALNDSISKISHNNSELLKSLYKTQDADNRKFLESSTNKILEDNRKLSEEATNAILDRQNEINATNAKLQIRLAQGHKSSNDQQTREIQNIIESNQKKTESILYSNAIAAVKNMNQIINNNEELKNAIMPEFSAMDEKISRLDIDLNNTVLNKIDDIYEKIQEYQEENVQGREETKKEIIKEIRSLDDTLEKLRDDNIEDKADILGILDDLIDVNGELKTSVDELKDSNKKIFEELQTQGRARLGIADFKDHVKFLSQKIERLKELNVDNKNEKLIAGMNEKIKNIQEEVKNIKISKEDPVYEAFDKMNESFDTEDISEINTSFNNLATSVAQVVEKNDAENKLDQIFTTLGLNNYGPLNYNNIDKGAIFMSYSGNFMGNQNKRSLYKITSVSKDKFVCQMLDTNKSFEVPRDFESNKNAKYLILIVFSKQITQAKFMDAFSGKNEKSWTYWKAKMGQEF